MPQNSKNQIYARVVIAVILLGLSLPGCANRRSAIDRITSVGRSQESQLEARERQTREFDGVNATDLLKVALNVLQDEGYAVKNATVELGLLAAVREIDITDSDERIFRSIFMGEEARWDQRATIEATVNTTAVGGRARIRVTFQIRVADNAGAVTSIEEVKDPEFYRDFFSKLDKGLYLYREKL